MQVSRRTSYLAFLASTALLLVSLSSASRLRADARLPKIFGPHMVLQRDAAVPVWGWADDGERVTVSIQGQSVSAVASGGKWSLKLQPLKVGGPFTMTVAGKNSIELADVLVGDVWVSCGQSNMMMGLGAIDGALAQIAQSGKFPQLRLFNAEGDSASVAKAADLNSGKWLPASPDTSGDFSAVSYIFGRALNKHLTVPIGMLNVVAIVPAECWVDRATLEADPLLASAAKSPLGASTAYNGMIAPLQPFAIKGVIYYQGEYNAGRGREFRRLLPVLIQSWRKTWGEGEFPFLFVQLPGFGEHKAEKDKRLDMPPAALAALHQPGSESAWAELREAQLLTTQNVPHTGMAIAIDLGDAQDIHPKNKVPVGERLALAARSVAYGEKLVHSGPIFQSLTSNGSNVVLHFTEIGGGLVARGGQLEGFELGRSDGTYVFADAEIRSDTIVVSSPQAPQPVAVRYAWANYPLCTLYNAEGLPASPFRAFVVEHAMATDGFAISFNDPSFEQAGEPDVAGAANWELKKGATRTDAKASQGKWSLHLPVGTEASQNSIIPPAYSRYDWNSDPLERVNFRPGYVFGYSIDVAAGAGATQPLKAYLRLCGHSTAEAYGYWGGVPEVTTAGPEFTTRQVAGTMTSTFDMSTFGAGVGILVAFLPSDTNKGELLVDNLSPINIVRPLLGVSDMTPIDCGTVAINTPAKSTPRKIFNRQARVLPDHRADQPGKNVPTILYGVANLKVGAYSDSAHVRGPTDDVGAVLIGDNAGSFEFVSAHRGSTPRELKLVGADGLSGLIGGQAPESEELVVRLTGTAKPGDYAATLRIVTQAANIGRRSIGDAVEPPEAFYYLDIAVIAHVKP